MAASMIFGVIGIFFSIIWLVGNLSSDLEGKEADRARVVVSSH